MTSKLLVGMAIGASMAAMLLADPASADTESLRHDGTSFVHQADGSYLHVDDQTGQAITEDDPRWSCVDDGNRICGPGNIEHQPAGCYDDGGVIVAPWPCHVVVNADGSSDVYEGLTSYSAALLIEGLGS